MVGYTRARFLSGSSALNANLGVNESVGGHTLPYAPEFNANMGTQISWAPSRYARIYFRVQLTKYGDFQYDASNAAGQTSYHLVNFRGGRARETLVRGRLGRQRLRCSLRADCHPLRSTRVAFRYIGESGAPVTYGARLASAFSPHRHIGVGPEQILSSQ